ncbi:MAG: hypothetical protein ACXW25_09145, partial [Rhodospirillales bacterium]
HIRYFSITSAVVGSAADKLQHAVMMVLCAYLRSRGSDRFGVLRRKSGGKALWLVRCAAPMIEAKAVRRH